MRPSSNPIYHWRTGEVRGVREANRRYHEQLADALGATIVEFFVLPPGASRWASVKAIVHHKVELPRSRSASMSSSWARRVLGRHTDYRPDATAMAGRRDRQ